MNPIRRLAKISRRKFFISRSPGSLGGPYETVQIQATTVAIPSTRTQSQLGMFSPLRLSPSYLADKSRLPHPCMKKSEPTKAAAIANVLMYLSRFVFAISMVASLIADSTITSATIEPNKSHALVSRVSKVSGSANVKAT